MLLGHYGVKSYDRRCPSLMSCLVILSAVACVSTFLATRRTLTWGDVSLFGSRCFERKRTRMPWFSKWTDWLGLPVTVSHIAIFAAVTLLSSTWLYTLLVGYWYTRGEQNTVETGCKVPFEKPRKSYFICRFRYNLPKHSLSLMLWNDYFIADFT